MQLTYTGGVVGFGATALGEFFGLKLHEIAVHEEEALRRNGSDEALFGADHRGGEIEQGQILVELVAADLGVNGAAVDGRGQVCRRR